MTARRAMELCTMDPRARVGHPVEALHHRAVSGSRLPAAAHGDVRCESHADLGPYASHRNWAVEPLVKLECNSHSWDTHNKVFLRLVQTSVFPAMFSVAAHSNSNHGCIPRHGFTDIFRQGANNNTNPRHDKYSSQHGTTTKT